MDPDRLLLGVILARLWRPWARSAVAGMIWKTNGSVVALGAFLTAETATSAPTRIRTTFSAKFTICESCCRLPKWKPVVLARLWRPWVRSAAVGMIWKTDGSVVALGGILGAVTEI